MKTRPQHLHGPQSVLQLAALVLHRDDKATRSVGDPHRRIGGVDMLAPGTRRAVHVDIEVVLVDGDFYFIDLSEHGNGGRGGVDSALALGDRHALHSMRPAFEVQPFPRIVSSDHDDRGIDATECTMTYRELLHSPSSPLGIGAIHSQQISGEQVGLLATLCSAHLHDHGTAGIGVGRYQQGPRLHIEFCEIGIDPHDFCIEFGPLVDVGAVAHLDGRLTIAEKATPSGNSISNRHQLPMPGSDRAQCCGIGRSVGHGRLELDGLDRHCLEPCPYRRGIAHGIAVTEIGTMTAEQSSSCAARRFRSGRAMVTPSTPSCDAISAASAHAPRSRPVVNTTR